MWSRFRKPETNKFRVPYPGSRPPLRLVAFRSMALAACNSEKISSTGLPAFLAGNQSQRGFRAAQAGRHHLLRSLPTNVTGGAAAPSDSCSQSAVFVKHESEGGSACADPLPRIDPHDTSVPTRAGIGEVSTRRPALRRIYYTSAPTHESVGGGRPAHVHIRDS